MLHYQIVIYITLQTMSSNNSNDNDDDDNNNYGVHTFFRDRLGGRGSLDDNDNHTDHHQGENQLPSSVPRMNERQE